MRDDIDRLIAQIQLHLTPPASARPTVPGGILPVSQHLAAQTALEALQRYLEDPLVDDQTQQYLRERMASLPGC